MRQNIKAFIKEIIPVIVGILIALWINNWNEDRKDRKYIDQISISINKELAETNQDIVDKIAIQETFIDTLNFYLNDDKVSMLDITTKAKGFSLPSIKINSLKALSNSKIELMEYEKISALANIEEQKEILKDKTQRLAVYLYANLKESGSDKKEFVKLLIADIIGTEKQLKIVAESIIAK